MPKTHFKIIEDKVCFLTSKWYSTLGNSMCVCVRVCVGVCVCPTPTLVQQFGSVIQPISKIGTFPVKTGEEFSEKFTTIDSGPWKRQRGKSPLVRIWYFCCTVKGGNPNWKKSISFESLWSRCYFRGWCTPTGKLTVVPLWCVLTGHFQVKPHIGLYKHHNLNLKRAIMT